MEGNTHLSKKPAIKKSDLIALLEAIPGDPEIVVMCDRDIMSDDSDFDASPAYIHDVREGIYATREIPDENAYEIFTSKEDMERGNRIGEGEITNHGPRVIIEMQRA